MRSSIWVISLLLAAFAGCAGDAPADVDDVDDHDHGDHDHGDHDHGDDGNGTDLPGALEALLSADVVNGTAPLLVEFTIGAERDNATWSLDFGDGNGTQGDSVPAQVNHTFLANATVTLTVTAGNQTATASQNITVAAAATAVGAPEVTSFTFGESLGCAQDIMAELGDHCLSEAHPDDSGIDGFWIELGPAYEGWTVTTTVDNARHDSDCYFTDASLTFLSDANNSDGPCMGTVPAGAAWLFLYSYAEPALGQTAEFTLA